MWGARLPSDRPFFTCSCMQPLKDLTTFCLAGELMSLDIKSIAMWLGMGAWRHKYLEKIRWCRIWFIKLLSLQLMQQSRLICVVSVKWLAVALDFIYYAHLFKKFYLWIYFFVVQKWCLNFTEGKMTIMI